MSCRMETRKTRLRGMIAGVLLAFSLLVKCFWPEGSERIRAVVLPDELTKTQKAVQSLFIRVKDGDALQDALTAFCVEIIEIE